MFFVIMSCKVSQYVGFSFGIMLLKRVIMWNGHGCLFPNFLFYTKKFLDRVIEGRQSISIFQKKTSANLHARFVSPTDEVSLTFNLLIKLKCTALSVSDPKSWLDRDRSLSHKQNKDDSCRRILNNSPRYACCVLNSR